MGPSGAPTKAPEKSASANWTDNSERYTEVQWEFRKKSETKPGVAANMMLTERESR